MLLANKTGATRLGFAVLLKAFQRDGCFPDQRADVSDGVIEHLARQVGVPPDVFHTGNWTDRTWRRQRAHIRAYCGFRTFHARDEMLLVNWLSERVTSFDPDAEALTKSAYQHLRTLHIVPPPRLRMHHLRRVAVRHREAHFCSTTFTHLSGATHQALDALIQTDAPHDETRQPSLFPIQSELATLKDDAGAVKIDTVLEEIRKLQKLRMLNLPPNLFRDVPPKLVAHYRQRAATEPPRELRRHPPEVRVTLLAALCWQRTREITDTLVDLLIHIAHRIGVRAEQKVDAALLKHLKKVVGKTRLLYTLAKVAKQHPHGTVKDVIYPAVGEQTLDDLITEAETDAAYDTHVRLVTRASYGHHYRRVVPALLEVVEFRCINSLPRSVMHALVGLRLHWHRKTTVLPLPALVAFRGRSCGHWQALVLDEKEGGRINRISYEMCVLTTLREKVRCKESWVVGAQRLRNPDEDLPHDFDHRRAEYYAALAHPLDARTFVDAVRDTMAAALGTLDADVPHNAKVKLLTSKTGKGRISVSPLDPLRPAPNLSQLNTALTVRWPMTNLLDILKETELRVRFTKAFQTVGTREVLAPDVLQRRLLLCLHGLGTNAGLKRMSSGGGEDSYDDLLYVRRRYVHKEQLRTAITMVCNAIFAVRHTGLWGEGTTACASDSKQFGAWNQNLLTEWHARYGGAGVMVYYHVEEHSVCIYSQLKSCSSSEVAAMIEGVLRHDTEMEIDKNYVDTHGQSEVGFAFCFLLGFHLLPRLKNLKKQRLYRPSTAASDRYTNLQPVLTRPINWQVIEQQYDELVKFATALRLGTINAESILQRFTRSNVQHPTYQALAELGKALKTTFLCDYMRLESLRREIHAGLQVIETWNSANDFILYGKGGEFASNRLEDQEVLMLSLHLLQVSLVYINTLMIQQVLAEPAWQGRLTTTDLRALTPLLWGHVNPYGTFTLNMQERLSLEQAV